MISSSQSKLIRSLRQKKFREQHRLYVAEGEKLVGELLEKYGDPDPRMHQPHQLFATQEWVERFRGKPGLDQIKVTVAGEDEIRKVSNLLTPQPVLALVRMPVADPMIEQVGKAKALAFEAIRDPGNLGTILRTADWFGFRHVICSPDSVDCYNPKVVQSAMGSVTRVQVYYEALERLPQIKGWKQKEWVGTFLSGESIFEASWNENMVVVFGNESHGISPGTAAMMQRRVSIPSFDPMAQGTESLNVASSVAVICAEWRRRLTRNGN